MTRAESLKLIYTTGQDATLLSYLGDGKIYLGRFRPDNARKPCLTVDFLSLATIGQNFTAHQYTLVFSLFTENQGDSRQGDLDLSSAVQKRLDTLFGGKSLSDANGRILVSSMDTPSEFKYEDIQETVYEFPFKIIVL